LAIDREPKAREVLTVLRRSYWMRRFWGLFFLIFWLAFSGGLWASWHIEAQRMIFYSQTETLVAEGQVIIKGEETTILCPRARYELLTHRLILWGPVKILSVDGDYLEGSFAWLNLKTSRGEIRDGHLYIKKDRVHVLASVMKRLHEDEYEASHAVVTTCNVCPEGGCSPSWSFRCRRLRITPSGRAKAYHATFNVRRLPIIYTPYVSMALKAERKSGLLFPRLVHSSREGLGLELPFYWAVNDSLDFTFYPYYASKRGFMSGIEARYVLSEKSKGIIRGRYLRDRLRDDDYNHDGLVRTNQTRYWLTAKIDQEMSPSWMLHLDLDLLSDKDFLYEFEGGDLGFTQSHQNYLCKFGRGLEERNTRYRTNRLWIDHPFDSYFFQASATYYDSQIPGDQAKLLMPLPEVYFSRLRARFLGPFYLSGQIRYDFWWRDEGYQGHRLDLVPVMSLSPKLFSFLDLDLSYRLRHTRYWVDWEDEQEESSLSRTLYELEGRLGLTFYRSYQVKLWNVLGLRHVLRPEIRYFYRPSVNQGDLPLFEDEDRLPVVHTLRYGLLQFITAKEEKNDQIRYFDLARIWIYQNYDFESQENPFSDLSLDAELRLLSFFYLRLDASYNFYGMGLATTNLSATLQNSRGEHIGLDYRWDKARKIDQINLRMRKRLYKGLYVSYAIRRSLEKNETIGSQFGLSYQAQCWYGNFVITTNPDETRFSFFISLLGVGSWGKTFGQ